MTTRKSCAKAILRTEPMEQPSLIGAWICLVLAVALVLAVGCAGIVIGNWSMHSTGVQEDHTEGHGLTVEDLK